MAFHLYAWIWETSSTTGTGDITLGGAVTGWRSFSSQFADGDTCYYAMYDGTNFEEGIGTYHAGANSLSRTTPVRSSNSNAAVNWGSGTRQVTVAGPGFDVEQLVTVTKNGYVKRTGDPSSGTPSAWAADLAGQLLATQTNDNASAGNLGEYASSTVLIGSAVSLTTGVAKDVTTLSLTAGDWEVWGEVWWNPNAATTMTNLIGYIGTAANTLPAVPSDQVSVAGVQTTYTTGGANFTPTSRTRWSNSGTVTARLGAIAAFATNTLSAYGILRARRVR